MLFKIFVLIIICTSSYFAGKQFANLFGCFQTDCFADSKIKTKFTLGLIACSIPFMIPQQVGARNMVIIFFLLTGVFAMRLNTDLKEEKKSSSGSADSESTAW